MKRYLSVLKVLTTMTFMGMMAFPASAETTPVVLECVDCSQDESEARAHMISQIQDVVPRQRTVKVVTYNLERGQRAKDYRVNFFYTIDSGESSERGDFLKTTGVSCPRGCEIRQ